MAQVEEEIIAENVEIIWVMEQTSNNQPGTAENCRDFMDGQAGSDKGYCVGDSQTEPVPGTFDSSPFSTFRGFDMIVTTDDMVIQFASDHGTPAGNDNLTGQEILDEIRNVLAD